MEQFLLATAFVIVAGAGVAAAVLLVRERREAAALRARNAALTRGVDLRERELRHLADVRLPELRESLTNPDMDVAGPCTTSPARPPATTRRCGR
ncbi:hypothetical protein OHR68_27150 [Spirillospora sp. NBC_00431]